MGPSGHGLIHYGTVSQNASIHFSTQSKNKCFFIYLLFYLSQFQSSFFHFVQLNTTRPQCSCNSHVMIIWASYQDVVRLDVSVEDAATFEEFECQEELLGVGADSLDVKAHVLTVLLQHLAQVHTETHISQRDTS